MKLSCGAKTRSGQPCRKEAGWGTDHFGQGRCRLHGGKVGRQLKHGRYSKVMRHSVGDLVEKVETEMEPLDALPELALMRALLVDWVERYCDLREAVLAWHTAQCQDGTGPSLAARPEDIPQIGQAGPLLECISRMVYRIQRSQQTTMISRADFYRAMTEMGRVIESVVTDPDQRRQIREGWLSIRLT